MDSQLRVDEKLNFMLVTTGGAKNHLVALPDCDIGMTSRDIVARYLSNISTTSIKQYHIVKYFQWDGDINE